MFPSMRGIFDNFRQISAGGCFPVAGIMLSPAPKPALSYIVNDTIDGHIRRPAVFAVILRQFLAGYLYFFEVLLIRGMVKFFGQTLWIKRDHRRNGFLRRVKNLTSGVPGIDAAFQHVNICVA